MALPSASMRPQQNVETVLRLERKALQKRSVVQRIADRTTAVAGSIPFLVFHIIWFGGWLLINAETLPGVPSFDRAPFGLLTLIVSLEAIFLTLLVLMSQDHMMREADKRTQWRPLLFRYTSGSGTKASDKLVGSLLLGLFDTKGLLHHVGFTSSFKTADRAKITKTVLRLVGGTGFTGRAPGGPSRWSTKRSSEWVPLKPKLVVEVEYDHFTDGRFRHGTQLLRWRPDKPPPHARSRRCARAAPYYD